MYYAWVWLHIPWEVKYINQLLKQLERGVKEFESINREAEIEEVARVLLQ